MRFETLAIHAGQPPDPTYGAVMQPIYLSSTYAFKEVGVPGPFDYGRSGNPTRKALEDCLAALEGGAAAAAFATGMAAEATILAMFGQGDHLVVHNDLYGGTYRLIHDVIRKNGVAVDYVDMRDIEGLRGALRENTRGIWAETPTNPLMNLLDLSAIAEVGREAGVTTICDNTFLSPYFQQPIAHGFDLVLHSTTKYLNGHSDVVGGAVVSRTQELAERMFFLQNALGTVPGPFDCYMVLRGLKTLPLRMEAHNRNALAVAQWLQQQPAVSKVHHPGLPDHPQHELAKRQMRGFGGTFSFRMRGGEAAVRALLGGVKLFSVAESLGGVESLIEHPWTMTHLSMPADVRERVGITADLIRISVGIEHVDDLIADLAGAMPPA